MCVIIVVVKRKHISGRSLQCKHCVTMKTRPVMSDQTLITDFSIRPKHSHLHSSPYTLTNISFIGFIYNKFTNPMRSGTSRRDKNKQTNLNNTYRLKFHIKVIYKCLFFSPKFTKPSNQERTGRDEGTSAERYDDLIMFLYCDKFLNTLVFFF